MNPSDRQVNNGLRFRACERIERRAKLYIRRVGDDGVSSRTAWKVMVDNGHAKSLIGGESVCYELDPGEHKITVVIREGHLFRVEETTASEWVRAEAGETVDGVQIDRMA